MKPKAGSSGKKKINKIDKPLLRLTKKKRERTQMNIRNEKGNITTDLMEIKSTIKEYYEELLCSQIW